MTRCVAAACLLSATASANQPNVVIIVADDQRPDAIGALGGDVSTPHLDSLVEKGSAFTRAYCRGSDSGAVCAPSRAMLLAGRDYLDLPAGFRVPWRGPAEERGRFDGVLLPRAFREAGYDTFATGKWHNGKPTFAACFSHGDEIFFGGMGSHTELMVHDFDPTGAYAEAHQLEAFSSEAFATATVEFIESRGVDDPPFFVWTSFTAPHDPRTPPTDVRAVYDDASIELPPNFLTEHPFDNGELVIRDENLAPTPRTEARVRSEIADYYAMITHMDAQIGRILSALEASGLADETIVVFLADHGLAIGSHGLLGKQNLYEHSMGAPLVFAGPGLPAGERFDDLVYLHDLYPTVCDLAGVEVPASVTSRSLAPRLRGRESVYSPREAVVLGYRDVQRALVTARWKLIAYPKIDRVQLFDLEADPWEVHDLSRTEPARARRMLAELTERLLDAGDLDLSGMTLSLD